MTGTNVPRLSRSAVALVLVLAYGLLGAVLVGMPLTEVARVYYGGHPQGDAPLAAPGGLALGDLILGRGAGAISAALPTSIVLAVLVAGGAHLPFGALLVHLSRQGRRGTLREAYGRSAARFFVLGSASLVSLAARAVVTLLAMLAAGALSGAAHGPLDDRAADLVGLAALLPFGALLFVLHVVTDLTYVGIAAHDQSLPKAVVAAVRTFRSRRRQVAGPALVAYVGSLAALALAGGTVGFLAISANAGLVFLAHQGALVAKGLLRARWLAIAITKTTAEDPLGPPSVMPRDLVSPEVRPSEPHDAAPPSEPNDPEEVAHAPATTSEPEDTAHAPAATSEPEDTARTTAAEPSTSAVAAESGPSEP